MNIYHIFFLVAATCSTEFFAQEAAWRAKFNQYDFAALTKTLGYDPSIAITQPAADVTHGDEVTVYAHAWADSKESVTYFRNNSLMLPGTIVGFNFKDAHRGSSLPPFWRSNFAQEEDIATLISVIKVLTECGVKKIHLFGHSRGGGTLLTMLARLYKYETYKASFQKLGITKKMATDILDAIKKGSIVLNCPLVDTKQLIREKLGWAKLGFAATFFSRGILPLITKYNAFGDNPIKAARILKDNKFDIPTFIHFEKDDVIISTRNDYILYEYLHGNNTYLTIGEEGSHMHAGKQLGQELQAFYKKYGNAYYTNVTINDAALTQEQPTLNELTALFQDIQTYQRAGIIQYGDKRYIPAWQQKLTQEHKAEQLKKILGYDPQIRIYNSNDPSVEHNESVTVYVHGLGENAQTIIPYFKLNSYLLPGTIVTFDFPDVVPGAFTTRWEKLNLSQRGDIATLASILKMLDDSGLETIHLFGTSRGGATIVNTLGRLCDYNKHAQFFGKLSLSQEQAARIVQKIQRGTIVLNVSLVDSKAVAKDWGILGYLGFNYFIQRQTKHKAHKDQAIAAAEIIKGKNFNLLVHFEYKDFIVGNSTDAQFYKAVMGPNTYLVLADDGGHLHSGYTLGRALQAFRKKYGGAYYNKNILIEQGDLLLQESPREKSAVDAFVADSYANFEVIRKQKKK